MKTIFDKLNNDTKVYSHESQASHKRYLDILKQEFHQNYSNYAADENEKSVTDFDAIRTLGVGAFGTVFLVRDKLTMKYHAMKSLEKTAVVAKNCVKQLYLEMKIMHCVNFPFVISLDFVCKDNLYIYFLLPFEPGGELFTLIRRLGVLSEPLSQFYAAQLVLALEYLHHCSVIHRDVKPENVFISRNGYLKLGDFGFCKVIKTRTWTLCGTPEYLAPEIIMSKGYTLAVDWWALGVLIYEMISGYPPFYNSDPIKLYEKILKGTFKTSENMSPQCRCLVKNFLEVEASKRIGSLKAGVYDIKSHTWFKDTEWDSILHQKLDPPYVPIQKDIADAINFPACSDTKLKHGLECLYEKDFELF